MGGEYSWEVAGWVLFHIPQEVVPHVYSVNYHVCTLITNYMYSVITRWKDIWVNAGHDYDIAPHKTYLNYSTFKAADHYLDPSFKMVVHLVLPEFNDIHDHEPDPRGELFIVRERVHALKVLPHPSLCGRHWWYYSCTSCSQHPAFCWRCVQWKPGWGL